MVKASFTLANGTVVQLEGTEDEVRNLLQFYESGAGHSASASKKSPPGGRRREEHNHHASAKRTADTERTAPDLSAIVNSVKNCGEAESIGSNILDGTSQVDRTLLPLYMIHQHLDNAFDLSSGEISKIMTDLGVPVSQPNASKTLSGTASKYVVGDRVRKKGHAVHYKLSRRGLEYMQSIIGVKSDENAG